MILILLGVYIVVFGVYFSSPLPVRLLIMLLNCWLPDPIPVIDEVIMMSGILSKLLFVERIMDFVSEHKILSAIIGAAIIFMVIGLLLPS